MNSMLTRRYRHSGDGAGKGSENGVRPKGNYLQRKVQRAGPSDLGVEKRQARRGLGSQISDCNKLNRHVQTDSSK
jgi:hypothetical protein